ncbi:helix-turn-helix domain-containing protein [Kitasatospora sp. HPMI-4]|uniref:helix-turn-helix domain-containing protein n=1 Tax=Kitasatospora sp. HPMI-4 TaxID=3448443 RepID=UPI003F19C509
MQTLDSIDAALARLHVLPIGEVPLPGTVFQATLGSARIALLESGPGAFSRPGLHSCGRPCGNLTVCQPRQGEVLIEQDGRQAIAAAGELIAIDTSRDHRMVIPGTLRMALLSLPHSAVGLAAGHTDTLTAVTWPGTRGADAVLGHLLDGLVTYVRHLEPATAEQVGAGLANLFGALAAEHFRKNNPSRTDRQELLQRIQAFAREHLADPRLTPAELARRHHVSLRYLQKLFHEQGTSPASWIRDERLARCRTELHDPRFAHLGVGVIGERSGIMGSSHFTRLFRERYGMTPGEYRRRPPPIAIEPPRWRRPGTRQLVDAPDPPAGPEHGATAPSDGIPAQDRTGRDRMDVVPAVLEGVGRAAGTGEKFGPDP